MLFFVFFFSSRRRHTRCLSDWSSDVCSSDLRLAADSQRPRDEQARNRKPLANTPTAPNASHDSPQPLSLTTLPQYRAHPCRVDMVTRKLWWVVLQERSEERRVGKE